MHKYDRVKYKKMQICTFICYNMKGDGAFISNLTPAQRWTVNDIRLVSISDLELVK